MYFDAVTSEADDCVSQIEENNSSQRIPFHIQGQFWSVSLRDAEHLPHKKRERKIKSLLPVTKNTRTSLPGKHCDENETYFNAEPQSHHLVFLKYFDSRRESCMNSSVFMELVCPDSSSPLTRPCYC